MGAADEETLPLELVLTDDDFDASGTSGAEEQGEAVMQAVEEVEADLDEQVAPASLPGVARHAGPPATHNAGQCVIRNFCLILFNLLRDRVDPSQGDVLDAIEDAFVKRSVGRLAKAYRLDESIPDFFLQLSIIDPLKLRLSKLYDIEPQAEMVWTQLLRTMADRAGYLRELAHLRQIYTSHMYLFEAHENFPATLEQLVRLVDAQPESALSGPAEPSSIYLDCCRLAIMTLRQADLVESAAIEAMQDDLRVLLGPGAAHVILRFVQVQQVSTELVASIIDIHNLLTDQGRTLWMTELNDTIEHAFRASDPDGVMNIEPTLGDAVTRAAEVG